MAYSNFKWGEVKKKFDLAEDKQALFSEIKPLEPSDWLKNTLAISSQISMLSEKAKSELLVSPILVDFWNQMGQDFSFFSGVNIEADNEKGLNGECDFILSLQPRTIIPTIPIFTVVEAKNDNIALGLPQCVAQMLGAKIFNEKEGSPLDTIFGCVTTGEDWQFLKLQNNLITIDNKHYYISEVEKILGVLKAILSYFKK